MAKGRREKKTDEQPAELPLIRFTPLEEARWEDSGYLPSDEDQSWREMEAVRIAAYDRIGHLPPQDDQSWREREALRLAAAREASEVRETADQDQDYSQDQSYEPGQDYDQEDDDRDREPLTADFIPEPKVPVPEFVPVRRGSGGVLLLLVAVVGFVTLALASPEILTPDFWRAQWAASTAKPAPRVANIPAPPAIRPLPPQVQPAPVSDPGLNPPPPANSEPPVSAEPPANAEPPAQPVANAMPNATPRPRPDTRTDRTMVIGQDGSVKYEDAAAGSKSVRGRRTAVPDAGGFYAMTPGPDGKLRRQFFPSGPQPGSGQAAHAPSRDDRGGVYAMAPGPDGKLTYQYFPARPSR
jgi:hypothetical protein